MESYEEFTDKQKNLISRFVTSADSNVFALRNLPEVIKGALFSRYSRSSLGLRSLLLKEFILGEETQFEAITGNEEEKENDQMVAIKKAQSFYDRILDGYGDDSIGELGGAHLAAENISMIAAKEIEDARIGGSPLEKSTRYIYFDQKVNGEYLFYKEPVLMTSAYRDIYLKTCNDLFETYGKLIPPLTELMEKKFPKDAEISAGAYKAALRAKVLDCLRGLLPASAMTNMGVFGNGRFFETLIQKLHCNNLSELQDVGRKASEELSKVIPSFVRRADVSHRHQKTFAEFKEKMTSSLKGFSKEMLPKPEHKPGAKVSLHSYDQNSILKLASALLFPHSDLDMKTIEEKVASFSPEEIEQIFDATCHPRHNRRHKSPRALEQIFFTFEITADFGIYRDLQRHRMLTQERQLLSCNHGYYVPEDIIGTDMEQPYIDALENAKKVYDEIQAELPEEAQYVVPMAYNIRWYFHINLRALQWLCELRSQPAGHPAYRLVAQEMAKQVIDAVPAFERFFKFVDFDGYELGRLGQEIHNENKQKARQS